MRDVKEIGERLWGEMSLLDRSNIIWALCGLMQCRPETILEGKPIEEIVQVQSFDDLPSSLRGNLILSMVPVEDGFGFSLEEWAQAKGFLRELALSR